MTDVVQSWQFLKKGDVIDLVAPDVKDAIKLAKILSSFRELGYIPRIDRTDLNINNEIIDKNYEGEAKKAILAADSKAIFFIVGNYAVQNILNIINDLKKTSSKKKICIGNGNFTSIYSVISKKWGWPAVYINYIDSKSQKIEVLNNILSGDITELNFIDLIPLNPATNSSTVLKAELCGGNLRKIRESIGKVWEIDSKNKIIYIEESGERSEEINFMLTHLNNINWFNNAKAIIFGNINYNEIAEQKSAQLIEKIAQKIKIPVMKFSTKTNKANLPILFGREAQLILGAKPKLKYIFSTEHNLVITKQFEFDKPRLKATK